MALKLEEIRALADRVAASHGLDVVDVEYQGGGGKHRTLRVFIEKNAAERARLQERVTLLKAAMDGADGALEERELADQDSAEQDSVDQKFAEQEPLEPESVEPKAEGPYLSEQDTDEAFLAGLPSVANLEFLSGITHGDCENFSRDFGTLLDVEELVPGTEYLLEVSSPGLDRKLTLASDYRRFQGSLVKLQTFEPVGGNRHWQGRIGELAEGKVRLDLGGKPPAKKSRKGAAPFLEKIEIALANIEKAQLVPDF